jgi:hypothetical protein
MSDDGGKDVWNREGSPRYHMGNIKILILILSAENEPTAISAMRRVFVRDVLIEAWIVSW